MQRQAPPGPAQLARTAARCPGDLAGLRDRALLLLSAAGFDAERLLALDCEHVRFTVQAAVLAVPGAGSGSGAGGEGVEELRSACPTFDGYERPCKPRSNATPGRLDTCTERNPTKTADGIDQTPPCPRCLAIGAFPLANQLPRKSRKARTVAGINVRCGQRA